MEHIHACPSGIARAVTNKSWRDHLTNEQLYCDIPKISKSIRIPRLRFAGHCWRSKDEVSSDLVLWQPQHGRSSREKTAT